MKKLFTIVPLIVVLVTGCAGVPNKNTMAEIETLKNMRVDGSVEIVGIGGKDQFRYSVSNGVGRVVLSVYGEHFIHSVHVEINKNNLDEFESLIEKAMKAKGSKVNHTVGVFSSGLNSIMFLVQNGRVFASYRKGVNKVMNGGITYHLENLQSSMSAVREVIEKEA